MNARLRRAFARNQSGRWIVYWLAGFPDRDTSAAVLQALVRSGADIVEIGIPFSDPIADGPTIQRAGEVALRHGGGLRMSLDVAGELRRATDVPIVLMGYYNPIAAMGEERFADAAAEVGADGVLIPDLPPEETAPLLRALRPRSLDSIGFVAPTTPEARIRAIAKRHRGFLYYVSLTGVTGADLVVDEAFRERVRFVKNASSLPVAVGFGVKTADQAREILDAGADAVVVASALVEEGLTPSVSPQDLVRRIGERASSFRAALGGVEPKRTAG